MREHSVFGRRNAHACRYFPERLSINPVEERVADAGVLAFFEFPQAGQKALLAGFVAAMRPACRRAGRAAVGDRGGSRTLGGDRTARNGVRHTFVRRHVARNCVAGSNAAGSRTARLGTNVAVRNAAGRRPVAVIGVRAMSSGPGGGDSDGGKSQGGGKRPAAHSFGGSLNHDLANLDRRSIAGTPGPFPPSAGENAAAHTLTGDASRPKQDSDGRENEARIAQRSA